ncbi:hypothetical protein SAMN02910292_01115 [Lachnospiraceae bacterium XBB2008]|nr:hypothetical protein SAMN02910292_01115 [Lachnospiraceae bacterium XBB2008]
MTKNIPTYFSKGIITAMSVLILIVVAIGLWPLQVLTHPTDVAYPLNGDISTAYLASGDTISFNFSSENRKLNNIYFYPIIDAEQLDAAIVIRITDTDGKSVSESRLPLDTLVNADWNCAKIDTKIKKNDLYSLSITLDGNSEIWIGVLPQSQLQSSYKTSDAHDMSGDEEGIPSREAAVIRSAESGESVTDLAPLVAFDFNAPVSDYVRLAVMIMLVLIFTYILASVWGLTVPAKISDVAVIAALTIQFLIMIPNIVYTLDNIHLDPSWRYFLNIAGEEGYKFGTDVFFTYGPLGYLCYMINTGNGIRFWLGVAIWCLIFALHIWMLINLYKLYREGKLPFIQIMLSVLSYLCLISKSTADNYMLYVLLLSVVIYDLGRKRAAAATNIMLVIMFFGKFSTFTSSVAFLTIYIVLRLIFNRDKHAPLLVLPGIVSAPVVYLIYEHSFRSLAAYVSGVLKISSGWMKTQQAETTFTRTDWTAFGLIVVLYLAVIIITLIRSPKRSYIAAAGCASLFFAYKYGVVTHGIAAAIWLTSLLFSVIFLSLDLDTSSTDRSVKYKKLISATVVFCCLITILQAYRLDSNFANIKKSITDKVHTATHLTEVSVDTDSILAQNPVPDSFIQTIGNDTVTAYPWETGYKTIYPSLNVVYSPSVQNCNEFIPWLDRLSALYFAGEDAPEYLIVKNDTIHGHVKYMENPLTWEALKDHYTVVDRSEGMYLLKKTKTVPEEVINLLSRKPGDGAILSADTGYTWLGTETYGKNDTVEVPADADYMVIHMEHSIAGKVKDFFWRTGPVEISITYDSGQAAYGTAVYPNLISGLSLDYLPDTLDELEMVLNAPDGSKLPHMTAFQFGGIGVDAWKETISVDWYSK